jgi:hypothetical protein
MSHSGTTPRLIEAVQELYQVFKSHQSRRHPEGCPCCVSDADKRGLLSKPLEKLTSDGLNLFARKVITTWGTVEDLKRFLPRLLELLVTNDFLPFECEALFGKLRLGEWQSWPAEEQRAIEEFLNAVWMDCLANEAGTVWLDELLCGLGNAVRDITPYLQGWTGCKLRTGYDHFVQFVDWNSATLLKRRRLSNSFWSGAEVQMQIVVDWFVNPETIQTLEQIFAVKPDADFSDALAKAIDRLSSLQTALSAN